MPSCTRRGKRTFRDRNDIAYEAARYLKSKRQNELVEVDEPFDRREGDDDGGWKGALAA
jgi:hypothetical protein